MNQDVLSKATLDGLRKIGDPEAEGKGLTRTLTDIQEKGFLAKAFKLDEGALLPFNEGIHIDEEKVLLANRLFARYGTEISGALLLAALPQAYAAEWASRVLVATSRLQEDFRRRIVRTALFLLTVMRAPTGDVPDVEGRWKPTKEALEGLGDYDKDKDTLPPWVACLALRRYHQSIRNQLEKEPAALKRLGEENAKPLNQEDLLGTLLTFTVTVFEVLERYGITWTADEQEAYLHVWDLVGARLGIASPKAKEAFSNELKGKVDNENEYERWIGLRPPSLDETRLLADQLRRRQWRSPNPFTPDDDKPGDKSCDKSDKDGARPGDGGVAAKASNSGEKGHDSTESPVVTLERWMPGRVLLRALLNELAAAMPLGTRALPMAVIRQLAPDVVRDRLNLGGGGVAMAALDLLPKRQMLIGRFTSVEAPNRVGGAVLRSMANEVTRRAALRFLNTDDVFFIPSLQEWARGLRDPMKVGIE